MKFPCPHCGTTLEAAPEHQGQKANCAYCSGTFTVPAVPSTSLGDLEPGELLARGLATVQPPLADGWESPDPAELQMLLPQYQIESLIGRGGMGAVYKGSQNRLGRSVAIKLLPAELAEDEGFVARFEREARTLAHLDHPGIIQVYDFGQTTEGHLYFVMEFVDGTDLFQMIHGPGLKPAEALEIITQVCDALQFAHSKGVVHRDIKPANILVTKEGRVKLADFGLARPMNAGASGQLTLTRVIMGTPEYMAPEQKRGEGDHRVDLFALGVMLYEMLCGRTPQGAWQPPSQRVQVDVRLDKVVIKAMQEEPERRYQQASEVKTDVDVIRTSIAKKAKSSPAKAPAKAALPKAPGTSSRAKDRSDGSPWKKSAFIAAAVLVPLLGAGAWLGLKPSVTPPHPLPNPDPSKVTAVPTPPVTKVMEEAILRSRWIWKSAGSNEEFGPMRFLADGKIEVPREKMWWINGWALEGARDFRVNFKSADGKRTGFWMFEMGVDMTSATTKVVPGSFSDSKTLRAIPDEITVAPFDQTAALMRINEATATWQQLPAWGKIKDRIRIGDRDGVVLDLSSIPLRDLTPLAKLRDIPIQYLNLYDAVISDIAPLRGLSLHGICVARNSSVSDLSPLAGMKLTHLDLVGTPVSDLGPLRGMPLNDLRLRDCRKIGDYSVVGEFGGLQRLEVEGYPLSLASLRSLKNVNINGRPSAEYWAGWDESQRMAPAADKLRAALQAAGAGNLDYGANAVRYFGPGRLTAALQGAKLRDLTVLRGHPVAQLELESTGITDVSMVRDLPIERIFLGSKGKVTDIRPLANCPNLEMVELCPGVTEVEPLRKLSKLKYISYRWDAGNSRPAQTAEEFWKEQDAKKKVPAETVSAISPAPGQWTPMFNGKDLAGWKSNAVTEKQPEGVFAVKNGELVVSGGPAMVFYVGPDGNATFKNFEFKAKVKTSHGSNSGIYFHTRYQEKGWPNTGHECQVNATHSDPKKTGGLYAVADVMNTAPHKDDEWFDCEIKVDGKHIVIKINGKVTTDWTQPADWDPAKQLPGRPGRKLGEGTIALQGHDPKGTTYYKDIFIKPLP